MFCRMSETSQRVIRGEITMKLHHTKYKENYKNYILECIDSEDELIGKTLSRTEKIKYLFDRFYSEYGWLVERKGKFEAMQDWLSGLAINIPCYYSDIIQLAKDMGSVDNDLTEKQEDKICETYFGFMARMVLLLEQEEK